MSILSELKTPVFQAEKLPPINLKGYYLDINGEIIEEKRFSLEDIKKMPSGIVNARLTSVSGWSVRVDWYGVKWADLMKFIHLRESASHVVFESIGGYTTCVSLVDLKNPRVLLAYQVGTAELEEKYGGPLRMVIPNLWGYKSCKWLTKIRFTNKMEDGYWEKRGYSRDGRILAGRTFDINTKTHKQIKGGEVTEF